MVEALAVLAVGVSTAVLAAQALHRLPPPPVDPAASYTPGPLEAGGLVEQQAFEHQQTGTVRTFKTRAEADSSA